MEPSLNGRQSAITIQFLIADCLPFKLGSIGPPLCEQLLFSALKSLLKLRDKYVSFLDDSKVQKGVFISENTEERTAVSEFPAVLQCKFHVTGINGHVTGNHAIQVLNHKPDILRLMVQYLDRVIAGDMTVNASDMEFTLQNGREATPAITRSKY
jgi:hypothetical protein